MFCIKKTGARYGDVIYRLFAADVVAAADLYGKRRIAGRAAGAGVVWAHWRLLFVFGKNEIADVAELGLDVGFLAGAALYDGVFGGNTGRTECGADRNQFVLDELFLVSDYLCGAFCVHQPLSVQHNRWFVVYLSGCSGQSFCAAVS